MADEAHIKAEILGKLSYHGQKQGAVVLMPESEFTYYEGRGLVREVTDAETKAENTPDFASWGYNDLFDFAKSQRLVFSKRPKKPTLIEALSAGLSDASYVVHDNEDGTQDLIPEDEAEIEDADDPESEAS